MEKKSLINTNKQGLSRGEQRRADREHEKVVKANEEEAYKIVNETIERLADLSFVLMPVIKRKNGSRTNVYSDIELVPATRAAFEEHLATKAKVALRDRQVKLRDEHEKFPEDHTPETHPECPTCHPEQAVPAEHCATPDCIEDERKCLCECVDCLDAKKVEIEKALEEERRRTCPRCEKRIEDGEISRRVEDDRLAHKSCLTPEELEDHDANEEGGETKTAKA